MWCHLKIDQTLMMDKILTICMSLEDEMKQDRWYATKWRRAQSKTLGIIVVVDVLWIIVDTYHTGDSHERWAAAQNHQQPCTNCHKSTLLQSSLRRGNLFVLTWIKRACKLCISYKSSKYHCNKVIIFFCNKQKVWGSNLICISLLPIFQKNAN